MTTLSVTFSPTKLRPKNTGKHRVERWRPFRVADETAISCGLIISWDTIEQDWHWSDGRHFPKSFPCIKHVCVLSRNMGACGENPREHRMTRRNTPPVLLMVQEVPEYLDSSNACWCHCRILSFGPDKRGNLKLFWGYPHAAAEMGLFSLDCRPPWKFYLESKQNCGYLVRCWYKPHRYVSPFLEFIQCFCRGMEKERRIATWTVWIRRCLKAPTKN